MIKKITDLWPDLLRIRDVRERGEHDEEDPEQRGLLQGEGADSQPTHNVKVVATQIQQDFKHLYWTRLIAIVESREEDAG